MTANEMTSVSKVAASAIITCAAIIAMSVSASAAAADLVGTWSGGGSVSLANGAQEKARCRAHYTRIGKSYAMSATCATSSIKVSQTAQLRKAGANSYSGTFFNPEYGITGRIRVTVSGTRQSVFLSGDAGRAAFSLRRR
jgi:uncharacterized protein (DUF2147 family)